MGKQYRTSKGRMIDMDTLRLQSEGSTAIGNMGVNGRGDKLGRGGQITEPANKRAKAYHIQNPKAVKTVSIKQDITSEESPETKGLDIQSNMPAKKESKKKETISKTREVELEDGSIKIVDHNENTESE